ncbi:pyridoxamine 5'-phosphate oxidase family protein [uncultured Litoreibacter sp.]|uniref:pyridoxamine 5'-phosphate oxidase family protein n=1 Tax=uncultured Litoreibacter sp. TaxID=1392394 RepID=UPI0026112F11|nr:pyridoxamine 5'-phosphate oxidase family protein [uncultured Litoreibacter sp.]
MATGKKLNGTLRRFIEKQPVFFVATADQTGRVNVSPKGLDTLRIEDDNRIVWLNLSGSGNETAAHVQATGRMTLMFCAFEGNPMILRVYGQAKTYLPRDAEWETLVSRFAKMGGSRQVFDLDIDLVQTSCGTGVPEMDFRRSRGEEDLEPYYDGLGPDGVKDYWQRKNRETIDGRPTGIFED